MLEKDERKIKVKFKQVYFKKINFYYHFELPFCHSEQSEKSLFKAILKNIFSKFNFSLSFSFKRFDLKGFLVITRNDRGKTRNDVFLITKTSDNSIYISSSHKLENSNT